MVDKNQENDEYNFAEMDAYDEELLGQGDLQQDTTYSEAPKPPQKDLKRNVLITIGIIIFLMILYKVIGYLFFSKKSK